jgi:hypothetical protein
MIPKFMHKNTQTLVLLGGAPTRNGRIPLDAELHYSVGDRIVQTPVQGPKFIDRKGRVAFDCQVCNGLAKVAIVVYHLVDGEPQLEEAFAVRGSTDTDLGQRCRITSRGAGNAETLANVTLDFRLEGSRELFQEQRNAIGKLLGGGSPSGPLRDFCLAPRNQLLAVVG